MSHSTDVKKVLLAPYHDITAFCSEDESRYVLTGVHYNKEQKRLEATNGRILITVPVVISDEYPPMLGDRLGGEAKDCVIPCKYLSEALKAIPADATLTILKHAQFNGTDDKVVITTTDLDCESAIVSKTIKMNFPKVDNVLPKEPPKAVVSLDAKLLSVIASYGERFSAGSHHEVKFEVWDDTKPVRITYKVGEEQQEAVALIMPLRK